MILCRLSRPGYKWNGTGMRAEDVELEKEEVSSSKHKRRLKAGLPHPSDSRLDLPDAVDNGLSTHSRPPGRTAKFDSTTSTIGEKDS